MKMHSKMTSWKVKHWCEHAFLTTVVLQFSWNSSQFPSLNRNLSPKSYLNSLNMYRKQTAHQHKAGEAVFMLTYLLYTQNAESDGMTRLLNRSFHCRGRYLLLTISKDLAGILNALCPHHLISLINPVMISKSNGFLSLCSGKSYIGAWAKIAHLEKFLMGQ